MRSYFEGRIKNGKVESEEMGRDGELKLVGVSGKRGNSIGCLT
jgi:hypothetical protein